MQALAIGLKPSSNRRGSAQFLKKAPGPIKTSNLGSSDIAPAMESQQSQVEVIDISAASSNASSVNRSNQMIVLEEESGEGIVIEADEDDPHKL